MTEIPVYTKTGGLNPDYLVEIWKGLRYPSMARVSKILAERDIVSPRTGRPYTRQNIHLRFQLSKEGREILEEKRNAIGL